MRLQQIQQFLTEEIRRLAREKFAVDLEKIHSEIPPKTELGDLAFPIAFELAKRIKQTTGEKKNPREIADALKSSLSNNEFIERIETAGAGYLNIFYDRARVLANQVGANPLPELDEETSGEKICVEHTSVNPNKSAHIGHVRNAVLGDTFARLLKATGKKVEIQNYIDNTGVQVADTVVGFIYLEKMDLNSIIELDNRLSREGKAFDYYCWDLYAKVGQAYLNDEQLKERRKEILHAIENGNNEIADIADYIAMRNVECLLKTMEKLDIRYDLLPRESEILHMNFWQKAFEEMKNRNVIRYETEGKRAGCWVMPLDSHEGNEEYDADKILVRSNGTVTYTGKDIAYQMWKLGLLGLDFNYKPFYVYEDGKKVWVTTSSPSSPDDIPSFGKNDVVYNVIDSRQSYTQEVVRRSIAAIFPEKGDEASIHLSYEMVALSLSAAEDLGFTISDEDRNKPFIEMSGRKGLGVKANDLIELLEKKALAEVEKRHPEEKEDEKKKIARIIAIGALRYFLSKYTRNTIVVFDFKEALSFEGETGAFCQYSVVRANSIFKKLHEKELEQSIRFVKENTEKIREILQHENEIWALLIQCFQLPEVISDAIKAKEPAVLAKYCFNLAKAFNLFYHTHRIIAEEDQARRALLIVTANIVRKTLTSALDILGIKVPDKM